MYGLRCMMRNVHELIYVSPEKLRRFPTPARRRWWAGVRAHDNELAVNLLKVVEFKTKATGSPENRGAHFREYERVLAQLRRSPRAPRPIEASDLCNGQWIRFEESFNQLITDEEDFRSAVFFLQTRQIRPRTGSGSSTRLLLHGSAENLTINGQCAPALAAQPQIASTDHLFAKIWKGSNATQRRHIRRLADDMIRVHQESITAQSALGPDPADGGAGEAPAPDWLAATIRYVVTELEDLANPSTSTSMTGYARITAVCLPTGDDSFRLLAATPLYIEYSSAPVI